MPVSYFILTVETVSIISVLSVVVEIFYVMLLVKVMKKDGPIYFYPVNIMILVNEGVALLGMLGGLPVLHVAAVINQGKALQPGSLYMGSMFGCSTMFILSMTGFYWTFIGGSGIF